MIYSRKIKLQPKFNVKKFKSNRITDTFVPELLSAMNSMMMNMNSMIMKMNRLVVTFMMEMVMMVVRKMIEFNVIEVKMVLMT